MPKYLEIGRYPVTHFLLLIFSIGWRCPIALPGGIMNIFKIHQGYRDLGISYGLPVYYVDCGVGINLTPAEVAKRLFALGCQKGDWVVLRGDPVGERGMGTFVQGSKTGQIGLRIEAEDNGDFGVPGWFPSVDRWIIWYKEGSKFNYHAMRPRQDMLIYKGPDILGFITATKDVQALLAIVVPKKEEVWDLVRGKGIRVYEDK